MNNVMQQDMVEVRKPAAMLIGKVILILTVAVLYVMQGMISIPILGLELQKNLGELNVNLMLIMLGVSLGLGLISLIFSIVGSVRGEAPLTKITVVLKAVMIPFFIINIVLWFFLMSGMMNPFLMLGIPVVAVLGVVLTYIYLLTTSLPDVIYTIAFTIKHKRKPSAKLVAGCVLSFFFVLDIVGSILIHRTLKDMIV